MKTRLVLLLVCLMGLSLSCRETEYVHVGENWAAVNEIQPSEESFQVSVKGKETVQLGQDLHFEIRSQQSGKLWVVQVSPDDSLALLFPNDRVSDNSIQAETSVHIPPKDAGWSIQAGKPLGKSVVAFVITVGDTDLQDVLHQEKSMTKALQLVDQAPSWGLDKLVIDVKE